MHDVITTSNFTTPSISNGEESLKHTDCVKLTPTEEMSEEEEEERPHPLAPVEKNADMDSSVILTIADLENQLKDPSLSSDERKKLKNKLKKKRQKQKKGEDKNDNNETAKSTSNTEPATADTKPTQSVEAEPKELVTKAAESTLPEESRQPDGENIVEEGAPLSISQLEEKLEDPNLSPEDRKKLRNKLKKKRQKQKKNAPANVDQAQPSSQGNTVEDRSKQHAIAEKLEGKVTGDDENHEQDLARTDDSKVIVSSPTRKSAKEGEQAAKMRQLEALRGIKEMDKQVVASSPQRASKANPNTSIKNNVVNKSNQQAVDNSNSLTPAERKMREAQDLKDQELQELRDKRQQGDEESAPSSSEVKLKEAQELKERELQELLSKNQNIKEESGPSSVEQKLKEAQDLKDQELQELRDKRQQGDEESAPSSSEVKLKEAQELKQRELQELRNNKQNDDEEIANQNTSQAKLQQAQILKDQELQIVRDMKQKKSVEEEEFLSPAERNLMEVRESKNLELQAVQNREENVDEESDPSLSSSAHKLKQAQDSKSKELDAIRNRVPETHFSPSERKLKESKELKDRELQSLRESDEKQDKVVGDTMAPGERNLLEARSSKERELEALRNRNLAGRKTKQLKKSINKNLQLQQQHQQQQGNMEWRKVGHSVDPIPETVTVMSPGYEQLAIEQNKNRRESSEKERETLLQYQQHPESLGKDSKYLFEMDFVFGLVLGKNDKAPDKYTATKAASKIVPNMLTTKKTIYYDPRYPPKVSTVESDPEFNKEGQVRYMVKGKVPVLPKKSSPKGKKSRSKNRKSTSSAANLSSPSSQNSFTTDDSMSRNKEQDSLSSPGLKTTSSEGTSPGEKLRFLSPESQKTTDTKESSLAFIEIDGIDSFEGSQNLTNQLSPMKTPKGLDSADPADPAEKIKNEEAMVTPTIVDNKGPSQTKFEELKSSKNMELEALRLRGIAQKKNEDFVKLQEQSDRDKAAYEAEKQDLERRKLSTSEYSYSGVGILPHDDLCLQQNKHKQEDRDKRRNTMLEYQQFGAKIQNEMPSHDLEVQRQRRYDSMFQRPTQGGIEKLKSNRDIELEALRQRPSGTAQFEERPSQAKFQQLRSSKDLELEALRQRSVAKKTNMEFSKLEEQSAVDRAAYEAEQKDLENRRSSTSDYHFSGNSEINPHDKLCLEQNRQKKEDREKKQGTILEYQRKSSTSGLEVGFGLFVTDKGKKSLAEKAESHESPSRPSLAPLKSQSDREIATTRNKQDQELNDLRRMGLTKAKSQSSREIRDEPVAKNKELQELDALRNQGLAKRGSQQFIEFEKMSSEDKALHDAAARDLEQRKARTSDYKFCGTKEISPIDAVYLGHNKWKKDTQKHDREALGIYDKPPEHTIGEDSETQSNAKFTSEQGYKKWEQSENAPIGDVPKEEGVESKCACIIM